MKKLLVLISMVMITTISSFANQSCRVYDSPNNNVASLRYSEKKCIKNGVLYINIDLSKPSAGITVVFVEVRDSNGKMKGTARIEVEDGKTANYRTEYENYYLKEGEWYSLSIAKASCIF